MNMNLRRAQFGSRRGFTLLEIVVVLTIMAFLAAMVLPSIGLINNAEKAKITQQRLEMVRTAILGPRPLFDDQGKPIIGGFVGDMGRLPMLYESVDGGFGVDKRWYYTSPYLSLTNDGSDNEDFVTPDQEQTAFLNEGQPRELWTIHPRGENPTSSPEDDNYIALKAVYATSWHGQYLYSPTDPVAQDHRFLAESDLVYSNLTDEDKEAFRRVQCEGKVSDGWGRAVCFFIDIYDDAGTEKQDLYMISAGPDGKIFISDSAGGGYEAGIHDYELRLNDLRTDASPDPNDEYIVNLDNVMLKIAYDDWYYGGFSQKVDDEFEDLQDIVEAIQKYFEDTGLAVDLYYRNGSAWEKENFQAVTASTVHPQPRVLWTQTPDDTLSTKIANYNWGVGWRSQYLSTPTGSTVSDQLLKDVWGRLLHFRYSGSLDPRVNNLIITSAGPNGNYGDSDDIEVAMPTVDSKMVEGESFVFNDISIFNYKDDNAPGGFITKVLLYPSLNLSNGLSVPPASGYFFFNVHDATVVNGNQDPSSAALSDPDGWVRTNNSTWYISGINSQLTTTPPNPATPVDCAPGYRWLVVWHDSKNTGVIDQIDASEEYRFVQVTVDDQGGIVSPSTIFISMP